MPNKGLLNIPGGANYETPGDNDIEADIRRTVMRYKKKKKKQRSVSADAVKIAENRQLWPSV